MARRDRLATILIAALAASAAGAHAQTARIRVVAECGKDGSYADLFKALEGAWAETPLKSQAPGLTRTAGGRIVKPEGDKLSGKALFKIPVRVTEKYFVDLTWPAESNARDVTVEILDANDGVLHSTKMNFSPDSANKWVHAHKMDLASELTVIGVRIDASTSTGPSDPSRPWQLIIDAARIDTSERNSAADLFGDIPNPDAVAEAPNPFGAPGETAASTATGTEQPKDDPFAGTTTVASAAPAATPKPLNSETTVDDPFGDAPASGAATTTAPAGDDDPFGDSTAAAAATPAPAASSAATSDDPFGDSAPTQVAAAATPAPAPTPTPAPPAGDAGDDPFGAEAAAASADPFASAGGEELAAGAVRNPLKGRGVDPLSLVVGEMATPEPTPTPTPAVDISFEKKGETGVQLAFLDSVDAALEASKNNGKPVLVLFSGESQEARSFERVLSRPEVAKKLGDFVLVRMDYRKNRAKAREYAVASFPYLVVMNKFGYTQGHIAPMSNSKQLTDKLTGYTQALYN